MWHQETSIYKCKEKHSNSMKILILQRKSLLTSAFPMGLFWASVVDIQFPWPLIEGCVFCFFPLSWAQLSESISRWWGRLVRVRGGLCKRKNHRENLISHRHIDDLQIPIIRQKLEALWVHVVKRKRFIKAFSDTRINIHNSCNINNGLHMFHVSIFTHSPQMQRTRNLVRSILSTFSCQHYLSHMNGKVNYCQTT